MSEEVKNEENNSKQKWLWLLLLLLLIIFVVIAIVVFLKDDGTAEAADNISDEISQEQVTNDYEPKEETGISSNEKTQKLVVTAAETQLASAITTSETASTPTEKTPVVVNVSDNSYFKEPVVLKIDGENYSATITDSNGNVSKYEGNATLSEDGKYSLTIKESDGKETTITFVIDKTNPVITGVEDGKTYNSEVTPIIEEPNIEKVTLTKDNSSVEYKSGDTITEDGTYTLTVEDKAGNSASVTFSIDTTAPELTVKKNITSMTKKSVTVTITANEEILLPNSDWKYVDDTKTIIKKVYRQNIEEDVVVKDLYNNEGIAHVKIANIDKVAPTVSVTTSNNNGRWSTNKDVTATLTVNEPIKDIAGWTKVDDTTFTKVYSDNKKEKFEIEDLVGNKTKVEFEVKRIDKVPPTITVTDPNNYKMEVNTEYVEKGYAAYDVVDKDVTNLVTKKYQFQAKGTGTWPFVDELDTSKLGTYKIIYIAKDKAGNEAKGTRTVTIVDTTAPIITLNGEAVINHLERGKDTYTELGAKSADNYDEAETLTGPSYINLYILNNEGQYAFSKRVDKVDTNIVGRYNLVYTDSDSNGNEAKKVTRMVYVKDTIAPTATIEYSTIEVTNKNVVATLKADEDVEISNAGTWNPASGYGTIFKKAYNKNTTQVVTITDRYGNTNTVEVKIENIDKVAPTAKNIEYSTEKLTNGSVVVTITATEPLYGHPGWTKGNRAYKITKTFTENTEETVILKDKAGNETPVTIKITNIDKIAPTLTVKPDSIGKDPSYSVIHFKLSDNRLVDKFEVNGTMKDISDSQWGDANYDVLASLLKEGENTIVLYDVAGNSTEYKFKIDWTAPTVANVEYSTTELTNGNVVVTITTSEPVYGHTGWSKGNRAYKITKTFTQNAEETVVVKDRAGNKLEIPVKVTNIDKVAPRLTVNSNSKGNDPYYSVINFKLFDDRLVDKFEVNGIMRDVGNSQWGDANFDVLASLVREGENTIVLYDVAGNKTERKFIIDRVAPVVTVESVVERVEDADGNWIDVKGGQRLIANEDVEIVNEPALVSVNGSSREYEITYSLFNPTHTGYHFINVIVRDRAGNETTADVEIFIPEYSTSNVSTTSTLISTPLRMTKSAPKAAVAPTTTTPVATEPENNNDKLDDLVQNDLVITEDNKDDSNVIPTDSIADNKKDEQIIPTDQIVEDDKEITPVEPVVEDSKKDVQDTAQTETVVKDETPVPPVEEPVEPATEPVVEEQILETIVTE